MSFGCISYGLASNCTTQHLCDVPVAKYPMHLLNVSRESRIFLLGDSLIGQLCRESGFCKAYNNTMFGRVMSAQHTNPALWYKLAEYKLNSVFSNPVYYLSHFRVENVKLFKDELFKTYKPTEGDILIIQFAAHFQSTEKEVYDKWVKMTYNDIVLAFQGRVFWFEPMPQHFSGGIWTPTDKIATTCNKIDNAKNQTQYWRVEIMRRHVLETDNIRVIPIYHMLAPMWNCHRSVDDGKHCDCTHYSNNVYTHVWFKFMQYI